VLYEGICVYIYIYIYIYIRYLLHSTLTSNRDVHIGDDDSERIETCRPKIAF